MIWLIYKRLISVIIKEIRFNLNDIKKLDKNLFNGLTNLKIVYIL
jgi:hypothetical protein